jgi:hypothetical protein
MSSCTASPISAQGFERAMAAFFDVVTEPSPGQRVYRLAALTEQVEFRLRRYFNVDASTRVILCQSGTDAMLKTAMMIAAAWPGEAITAILPSASETGTGVPMAAMCRVFDGAEIGTPLSDCAVTTVEVPLRTADGTPRSEDEVNDAFGAAAAAAKGKVIVYLTHGTKTGLIAPASPPRDAAVIVDACQARIAPHTVAAYLSQGWPVVVTGSKFFGGPAFSGAVLFPGNWAPAISQSRPHPAACDFGTALRWTAAVAEIDAFEPMAGNVAVTLSTAAGAAGCLLAANSALVPVGGLPPTGSDWAGLPSIFTFGVRDPMDHERLLSAAELRPVHESLANKGVLLGQPVSLGTFGGLRIAFGARDLVEGSANGKLARAFAGLEEVTPLSCRASGNR